MLPSEARFPLKIDWERVQGLPEWQRGGSLGYLESPLVAFPLKSEWQALQPRTLAEYPAPRFTSRDSTALELPSAVAKLAQFAREASWEVRAQSSMGNLPHGSTGRPTALKRLIALRFGAHPMTDSQAYAVYEAPAVANAWKPSSIMIWGPDLPPYAHCGMAELRAFLAEKALQSPADVRTWVRGMERVRRESEAFRKRRTAVRAQIRKVADEGRFKAGQAEDRTEWFTIDAEWRSKVADLQDGVFTSDEVAEMIDPTRKRRAEREGLS